MKKLFVWAVMAFIGAQAQAQIVSSRSSMTTREVIADPVSYKGWSTFGKCMETIYHGETVWTIS